MCTYRKLRHSTNGKLLINLSISLLGIYIFFVVGGHIRPYGDTYAVDITCAISSAILHYFMLVYFGWTAAEALNLYFSLVEVLEARSIRHYTLKAGLVVWGMYYNYQLNGIKLFLLLLQLFHS